MENMKKNIEISDIKELKEIIEKMEENVLLRVIFENEIKGAKENGETGSSQYKVS